MNIPFVERKIEKKTENEFVKEEIKTENYVAEMISSSESDVVRDDIKMIETEKTTKVNKIKHFYSPEIENVDKPEDDKNLEFVRLVRLVEFCLFISLAIILLSLICMICLCLI